MKENQLAIQQESRDIQAQDPILAMIQQATQISDMDTTKVQALMDMYYKNQDRKASKEFMEDFAVMQGKLPRVVAKRKNTQTNSNYAAIEDINKIVTPILTEYGFGVLFKTKEQTAECVTIEATLTHKSGHTESTLLTMPLDDVGIAGKTNKTKVHATGSAITYAKRYALCEILNISVGEQDTDGNIPGDMITEEQRDTLQEKLTSTETDIRKFCAHFKIDSLADMPASRYLAALGMLAQKEVKSGK